MIEDSMYDKLELRRRKREQVLVQTLPPVEDEKEPFFVSPYSRTYKKKRLVVEPKALWINDMFDSPTGMARIYLECAYPKQRFRKEQVASAERSVMPMYAIPSFCRRASYVDISGAWWSIMLLLGWNPVYMRGKYLGPGEPPRDFPFPDHKLARSSLVSIARSSMCPYWTGSEVTVKRIYNTVSNPVIHSLIGDVLGCIALDIDIRVGLLYCHVDGFIVPSEEAQKTMAIIEEWGLKAKIKAEGPAWVAGVGSYRVGHKKSQRHASGKEFSNLPEDALLSWLEKRVKFFAQRRK